MQHRRSWHRGVMLLALCGALWGATVGVSAQSGDVAEAKRLNDQVIQLYGEGRYDEAVPVAERSLAIYEKALGAEHPDVATSLNN